MTNEDLQELAECCGVDALFASHWGVVIAVYDEFSATEEHLQMLANGLAQPLQLLTVRRRGRSIKRIWDEQFPEAVMVA